MTIHAFCRRLLAAHPLAAGLDPRFRVLDASRGGAACATAPSDEALDELLAAGDDEVARAAAAYQPWRLARDDDRGARAPAQPGDDRAASCRRSATRSARPAKPSEERRALSPAEPRPRSIARAALERLLEGFHGRYEPSSRRSARRSTSQDLELRALALLKSSPALAASLARALRPRDGRRVPGHQPGPARPGRGAARARRRRLFMVGDEHQSIYRFRNADLEVFRREREAAREATRTATCCRCSATSARGPRCSPRSTRSGATLLDGFAELTAGARRPTAGRARSSCC